VRGRLKQGSWISINQIAQVLMNATDILIIGKLLGPAAVVPYVCTGKLMNVLAHQPQMLMQLAGPALSEMRVGESRERVSQVCITLAQATFLLSGAVVCVVLAVNQGFVGRWVGSNQYGGTWLTAFILLTMLLRHWNLTIGYALFSFGFERRLCITALVDGLVQVGAMALFVWMYGIIGAPLGMIAGVCLISLPANLVALARESQVSVWSLVQPLVPWAVRCAGLMVVSSVLARLWVPGTLLNIGLTASAVGLFYALVMFSLVLREPLATYVRPRMFPLGTRLLRLLRLSNAGT
jgi:O-antigen/teichoic acid export membrane protein